jgi:hypothetical protein
MRGAKTLSSLAVEVFLEEERIPPDRILLEAGLALLLGDRDTVGPVGRGGLRPRARLCAQQSVSAKSGCTFDLWADDASICPVELRNSKSVIFGECVGATTQHLRSSGAFGSLFECSELVALRAALSIGCGIREPIGAPTTSRPFGPKFGEAPGEWRIPWLARP